MKFLLDQKLHSSLQYKWFSKLLGLDYEIQYKKGVENQVADALSRRIESDVGDDHCVAITAPSAKSTSTLQPAWMQQVELSYGDDEECQQLIAQLLLDPQSQHDYQYVQGILKKHNRIMVGSSIGIRKQLIEAMHHSPLGGHSGQNACYQCLRSLFFWPLLKQDVIQVVRNCDICQRNKDEHVKYPGLLQPLPIPQQAWKYIFMDFIEKLPNSDKADTILVVVDRFTKYAHFIALVHRFSAVTVAQIFLDHIFKLHGLPDVVVSDRDKLFLSHFWQELFRVLGVSLHLSTSYHPQSDGQTERVNQCLETYLRCFACDKPQTWRSWLSLAEWWYNTSFHASLNATPHEALYGPTPLPLGPYADAIVPAAVDLVQQRVQIQQLLKDNLLKAQQRMKWFADLHRSDRQFQVGDWVYLKLQPYKQQSVAIRLCLKLSSRFYGPFQVLEKIGNVAYKLRLPAHSKIHPVFHVSLLKKHVGATPIVAAELPEFNEADYCPLTPEAVLQRRLIQRQDHPVTQWLIRWHGLDSDQASWEDQTFIEQQFPEFKS